MSAVFEPSGLRRGSLLSTPTGAVRSPDELKLGWPGFDSHQASLDIINFDHSGSVTAVGGNDPIGNRFREAARAIQVVQSWTTTARPKVSIIHFDQPSESNSGVVELVSRNSTRDLRRALRVPHGAVGTSHLGPSLELATQLAREHPDHTVRLTILSDFELTDYDPAEVFAKLVDFPGEIHAVVLGRRPPGDLYGANISITPLAHGDPPGALAAAIHRSLTATRRGRRLSAAHAHRTQPSIPPLSPGRPPL